MNLDLAVTRSGRGVIPANERVKKSLNWPKRPKSGPAASSRAGGDPYKNLFQVDKWIPAFAGTTAVYQSALRTIRRQCFTQRKLNWRI